MSLGTWCPLIHLDRMASEPQGSSCLQLPSTWVTGMKLWLAFTRVLAWNTGIRACVASTSPMSHLFSLLWKDFLFEWALDFVKHFLAAVDMILQFFFIFRLKPGLTVWPRLTSNSGSSFLRVLNAGITGVRCCTSLLPWYIIWFKIWSQQYMLEINPSCLWWTIPLKHCWFDLLIFARDLCHGVLRHATASLSHYTVSVLFWSYCSAGLSKLVS